jgi:hypothetical protein
MGASLFWVCAFLIPPRAGGTMMAGATLVGFTQSASAGGSKRYLGLADAKAGRVRSPLDAVFLADAEL